MLECHLLCQDMISLIWEPVSIDKISTSNVPTKYCLLFVNFMPNCWEAHCMDYWFHSYLLCTKPQASPQEATTYSVVTTCNITLNTAGGKIWKPKQCKLQPWTCNVLNCVVFLSLSVHKHSCHMIVHTCTYRHTLYLMTYSCPVWHSEYYRICSTFQNYFLDFTHFSIICNFRKSTATHKR